MSDPVTNIEIEDVLSSIRRLVSEETGSQPRPDPVRKSPQDNRLVLTPALRVSDDIVDVAKTNLAEQAGDGTPWNNPEATLFTAAQRDPENGDKVKDDRSEGDAPEQVESELGEPQNDEPKNDVAEANLAAIEAAPECSDADVSDAPDDTERAPADVYVMTDEVHHDDAPTPEAVLDWVDDDADQNENAPSSDGTLENLTPLSAKIEALETAIGETQDQWEPDGMAGDDYAGTSSVQSLKWQDHEADETSSDEVNSEFGKDATATAPDTVAEENLDATDANSSDLDFLAGEDSLMDEESLRELVADIVREELQGALGERITRNVRKLVRREIHRALTTQQLD